MANGTTSGPASGGAKSTGGLALVENAEAIARLYHRLVLLVGVQLLFSFLRGPLVVAARSGRPKRASRSSGGA